MFDRLLIANRGEIACRVIATARRMGVGTVAVYSDADADALHVALADVAVQIGGAAAADSYLRGEAIIAAARATGAQAIHPGYGFLSENPDFVDAVEAAGLVFVGPSAAAIRAMGLKDAAKKLMEEAGVPVVPGYHGANQDPDHLAGAAEAIGFPVLVKAVAGGGGKGMRRVDSPDGFREALRSARAEARAAFGNDDVLIEKYVATPRHIEVQVFGDGTRAVHLFERDCSLQRRHQKVIEEAPAPGMPEGMRAAMGAAAVRAAETVGYRGAGTVEFIVDASHGLREDRFWFMEMNTRLQVEHPVTEAITGIDLVEWQLRVAAGEPLPARQEDLRIDGHAFEARLYAEDAAAGFLPATGTLAHLAFPPEVRVDTGVRAGDTISPWYDPMIAKLVVHGPTRAVALRKLARALERTEVAGTTTNLAFLGALARHRGFSRGEVDTGLIARDLDRLVSVPAAKGADLALAAIGAAGLHGGAPGHHSGFHLWQPLRQRISFTDESDRHEAVIEPLGPGHFAVEIAGARHDCLLAQQLWHVDGERHAARLAVTPAGVSLFGAVPRHFSAVDPLMRDAAAAAGTGLVVSPMPGSVRAVDVAPGDAVLRGQRLAVLEAMKMEHALVAGRDGRVAEVLVSPGAQVEAGAPLIRLEEEP